MTGWSWNKQAAPYLRPANTLQSGAQAAIWRYLRSLRNHRRRVSEPCRALRGDIRNAGAATISINQSHSGRLEPLRPAAI